MRAVVCEKSGPDGYAVLKELPEPAAGRAQVIVQTEAMSLNFPDALQIDGLYQHAPPTPFVLGMEYAGTVVEIGDGVTRFRVGERVAGMTQGAFAERASCHAASCYELPDNISFEQGAASVLAGGTAVYGLKYRGGLQSGETVCVLGASGGTGSYAVQIAKAMGACVIAICSTPVKAAAAMELGADETIDLSNADLADAIKALTNGRGVDVAYDPVGGDAFAALSRRMAWNGRLLTVGYAAGRIPDLPVNLALVKGYALVGVAWSGALFREEALCRKVVTDLFDFVSRGAVRVPVDSRHRLEDFGRAVEKMRRRQVVGKLLLEP